MGVIEGGNVITGGLVLPGTGPLIFRGSGAPVAGTTYVGHLTVGDLYFDVATNDVYEYTEPAAVATWTRIDTTS